MGIGNGGGNNIAGFFGMPKPGENLHHRCGRCGDRKPDVSPFGSAICEDCKGAEEKVTACYSDHNEDIRTKGSCDFCHGREPI